MNTTKYHAYFTEDGSYGAATNLEILDTVLWTDKDWQQIEDCADNDRLSVARKINNKYKKTEREMF